jgi:hypothetical protein
MEIAPAATFKGTKGKAIWLPGRADGEGVADVSAEVSNRGETSLAPGSRQALCRRPLAADLGITAFLPARSMFTITAVVLKTVTRDRAFKHQTATWQEVVPTRSTRPKILMMSPLLTGAVKSKASKRRVTKVPPGKLSEATS